MAVDVKVSRGRPSVVAQCLNGCGWGVRDEVGTTACDNARAAARRHAERTGHEVLIDRTVTTYIRPA